MTAAEYIQKTYPQPWSEDAEKLVVFLVGATSHMVADVAWHSLLNVSQGILAITHKNLSSQFRFPIVGFILSMSCFGFDCDFSPAHHIADVGGDTVLAVQNDLSYVLKRMKKLPLIFTY